MGPVPNFGQSRTGVATGERRSCRFRMALRRLAIMLVILSPGRGSAERRRSPLVWNDIVATHCPSPLTVEPGSLELEPFWGSSLGGGLDTYRSLGATARLHAEDGWFAILDGEGFSTERRVVVPVALRGVERLGGLTLGAGATPLRGKVLIGDDTIVMFDVVTAVSFGVAMVALPDERLDHWFAVATEATVRARLGRGVSLDAGVHDTYVGAQHEVEVRLGIGLWIPDRP